MNCRTDRATAGYGGVAQLGERLLCKQEVIGSIPFTSTIFWWKRASGSAMCSALRVGLK